MGAGQEPQIPHGGRSALPGYPTALRLDQVDVVGGDPDVELLKAGFKNLFLLSKERSGLVRLGGINGDSDQQILVQRASVHVTGTIKWPPVEP